MTRNEFNRFKDFVEKNQPIISYHFYIVLYKPIVVTNGAGYTYSTPLVQFAKVNPRSLDSAIKGEDILGHHRKHIRRISCWVKTRKNDRILYF